MDSHDLSLIQVSSVSIGSWMAYTYSRRKTYKHTQHIEKEREGGERDRGSEKEGEESAGEREGGRNEEREGERESDFKERNKDREREESVRCEAGTRS